MTLCRKCGYERTEHDSAPEAECPSCGAIYAKVEERLARQAEEEAEREAARLSLPAATRETRRCHREREMDTFFFDGNRHGRFLPDLPEEEARGDATSMPVTRDDAMESVTADTRAFPPSMTLFSSSSRDDVCARHSMATREATTVRRDARARRTRRCGRRWITTRCSARAARDDAARSKSDSGWVITC